MPRLGLVLFEGRHNRNSLSALAGAVEVSAVADAYDIGFACAGSSSWRACLPTTPDLAVLAFSFPTAAVPRIPAAVRAARAEARDLGIPVRVVAGGPHACGDPAGTLALGFDAVFTGEAEESFPAWLAALAEGRDGLDTPGLGRLEGGRLRLNARPRPVDLDAFPPFAPRSGWFSMFELTRGCPWACGFCQTSRLFGRSVRHRGIASVVRWAEVGRSLGRRDLRFVSPDVFAYGSPDGVSADPARVEALLLACLGVFGRGHVFLGSFPSEARPGTISPDTVGLVRRLAANDSIVFGAQSGSDRMLERLRRGHDVAAVFRAARTILDAGLRPVVDFIAGLPGETDEDRAETRATMRRLVAMGATLHTHAFMPLPGTPLARCVASPVDPETRALILSLAGHGRQFGPWEHQERIAQRGAAGGGET